jgi:hypothetical protein
MLIQASIGMLLRRAMLIASGTIAMPAAAQESAIPNFTSANFGWLATLHIRKHSNLVKRHACQQSDATIAGNRNLCGQ